MTTRAADDVASIAENVVYESGFYAGATNAARSLPDGCKWIAAWYRGYDEAKRMRIANGEVAA